MADIQIFGETDHRAVKHMRTFIIAGLPKDVFVLKEGASSTENELDDPKASLQTSILFAYLYSRAPLPDSEAQIILIKQLNMVTAMLEERTGLPKSVDQLLSTFKPSWQEATSQQKTSIVSQIIPLVKNFAFDYKEIWEHYFIENNSGFGVPYRTAMLTLLDLPSYDAFMVLTKGRRYEPFASEFVLITQTARESLMIQRIRQRARNGKVAVFTGFAHMQTLCDDLAKDFKVKCTVLKPDLKF